MAQVQKVLGQVTPAATTVTDVYTVPSLTSAVVSTIAICNTNGSGVTVRLSIAKAGAVDTLAQYVLYNQYIDASSTYVLTTGLTLAAGDVIRVYASTTNVTVNVFGMEIS
jgi:hypothetical protein